MHGWLYSILIALANNVDNISVRIAYSIGGIKLDIGKNIWISAITFFISTIAAMLGSAVSGTLGKQVCGIVSMAILTFIGLCFLLDPSISRLKEKWHQKKSAGSGGSVLRALTDPEKSDMDHSKNIDFKEATLLGISLSINNVGGSLSAGMMGLNALLIGFLSALVSFLALWAGNYITDLFIRLKLGRKATVIAGIILIVIGVRQLW